ncbi:hypothetical protein FH972_026673 [Carpinus fangiana]|uniref:Major facilitator superfamily (MFS) profile domain-containing protein n=1 Tax=Carpinus fangiana TaxID=176857 RepID=A0A5N6L4Q0_9ROSI|nr:hypothetical protein FH972_026673 [Carpinus fangiana]
MPGDVSDKDSHSPDNSSEVGHDAEMQRPPTPEKPVPQRDPDLVEWEGPDDVDNPQNWSKTAKWTYTSMAGILTVFITFASSIFSTATEATSKEFGVSTEVMTLGTSLFVLGFAFGPIAWGPLSELYGRRYPLYFGYTIFGIFQIPVAVSQNLQTIFVCRFFGGFFGSAPLAVAGGVLADLWDPVNRGYAFCVFSGATFVGPVLGPIVGSFVTQSFLGWRWTAWLTAIVTLSFAVLTFPFYPETFAPVILSQRAERLRHKTKNWALHSRADMVQVSPKDIAWRYLMRPFVMMSLEPILVLITLYMSLVYGILYLFFEAYPYSFQEVRGWKPGVASLPFISIVIGVGVGALIIVLTTKYRFAPRMKAAGKVIPEERLVPMIIGGFLLPIGLFWFAWTSSPHITPWPQIIAGVPIGAGVMVIFLQGLNYIVDCYTLNANSGIAANTFFRSWVGAGFPMFATPMYRNLGVPWASSLLAFLCVALFPVPIFFYHYGAKIRSWSKFVPTL